jgi:hypothetical protein
MKGEKVIDKDKQKPNINASSANIPIVEEHKKENNAGK